MKQICKTNQYNVTTLNFRASASYGNFDSFYPTRSYYGAEDGTRVESQIDSFLPSREDFPDSFSEFKSKQPTYSNTIHRSQFSFENKSRETAIADNFKEDNRETIFYEKKTRHPQKPSRQYGDIFNDNSASDYSENERENKAPDESMTVSDKNKIKRHEKAQMLHIGETLSKQSFYMRSSQKS